MAITCLATSWLHQSSINFGTNIPQNCSSTSFWHKNTDTKTQTIKISFATVGYNYCCKSIIPRLEAIIIFTDWRKTTDLFKASQLARAMIVGAYMYVPSSWFWSSSIAWRSYCPQYFPSLSCLEVRSCKASSSRDDTSASNFARSAGCNTDLKGSKTSNHSEYAQWNL